MHMREHLALKSLAAPLSHCAEECLNCHCICTSTLSYCLTKGGEHLDPGHLKQLADCAEICRTSASFLRRGSERHGVTCGARAAICDRCAESCEKIKDDAVMQACAEACRRCAESCRKMAEGG